MKLKIINRNTKKEHFVDCSSFVIKEGCIICTNYDGSIDLYSTEDYSCEVVPKFMTKLKSKWAELTKPCPDEELLEDAVKYLCDILCIIEAIPDDETRVEYLRYIFKHADKWQEDEINELIHIAM